ncbi:MAG TPA: penicillin acylase family protein [Gemmataceae bacterium]
MALNWLQWILRLALGRRLPTTSGTLTVPGVRDAITVRRDSWGIPYIRADNDQDAWFGLGFCHGQDRAFQLETLLRVVRGTLAELVGADGLPVDKLARRIGFVRSAQSQLPVLDPDIRAMLDAYAAGVTAGGALGAPRFAHEFALLRGRPTSWTAADVLGLLKVQSFALVSNWDVELARYKVLTADGAEALKALDASYADWQPVTSPPGTHAGPALDALSADVAAFNEKVKLGGGSNNWAIAATRTRTGRPILANDPHLPGTLPPHWYLAHIHTPTWSVAGASFMGGPIFPAAHNGHGAWGVTVGLVDDTDLFLEEVAPDGKSVRQGDGFVACKSWIEPINVKGAATHEERVLLTPRGPIINALSVAGERPKAVEPPDSPNARGEPKSNVRAFSLRATWLDPVPVCGLLGLPQTRNFEQFRRCFAQWPGLSLNLAYADVSGTIGWQLGGTAPRRRKGNGTIPLPGWDDDAGWHAEPVPFEEMPHAENPPTGFIATANNKPEADGVGPFLSTDYADGYRIAAIIEELAARRDWDVAANQQLQLSVRSLPWREMKEIVLACSSTNASAVLALQLLRDWDGTVAHSAGAAVFELFVAELSVRVAKAKAPRAYEWIVGSGGSIVTPEGFFAVRRIAHLVRLLKEQPIDWFKRPWNEEIADALAESVRRLRKTLGPDPNKWSWSRLRPLTLRHALGAKRPFHRIFNLGPFPFGGDANTIAQAAVKPLDPTGDPGFMPSLRMVVDVGNWSASRFALPGGQSGNPLSPHYADQLPLWLKSEGVPIAWTEEEIAGATAASLILRPAQTTP